MQVIDFIQKYWVAITCILVPTIVFCWNMIKATQCTLRNDILAIYDCCKKTNTITKWQLQAIHHSADTYFKLMGNSFVKELLNDVDKFEVVD